jgi:DNA anti-recombination protein RmuC
MTWRAKVQSVVFGIAIAATAVPAAAESPQRPAHDPNRRAEIFQEIRLLESESHLERIRILQEAEACVQRAADFRAFRECEHAERQAREQLRSRLQAKRDALRDRIKTSMR